MKAKLLKKLTRQSRSQVNINSITRQDRCIVGMSYGYDEDCHRGLFNIGDTEESVMQKVSRIYIKNRIEWIRKRYKKYSIKNKKI